MHGMLTAAANLHDLGPFFGLSGPLAVWHTIWPYLLMLAGFSLIVFVHELGHFAVAKWAGVRVERFAIGFGREIFGFTRGETRYSFNILPLGGYVKMLGQEDFDDKSNELRFREDPRSFANKSVSSRMAIVSAGVIMNIIFACLLFMIVFMVGMNAIAPRIAIIEPDSPADKAGLLPGDTIREINNERVLEFNEVQAAIILAEPHEPIDFIVEREGNVIGPLSIVPEYRDPQDSREIKRQVVGFSPGVTREIVAVGPEVDATKPGHPHVGDVIVEIGGVPVTDQNASEVFNTLAYAKGDVWVERKAPKNPAAPPQRVQIEIPLRLVLHPETSSDPRTASVLGLVPPAKFVYVTDRGRAYYAGLKPGDTILMWDDIPHPTLAEVAISVLDRAERDIPFRVRRLDGSTYHHFVRPEEHPRGPATIHAVWTPVGKSTSGSARAKFDWVRPNGLAAQAGVASGDLILEVKSVKHPTSAEVTQAIRRSAGVAVSMVLQKSDGRTAHVVVRPQPPGNIEADFGLVANEVLVVSDVLETIDDRPSPAAIAGIPEGALIRSVNEEPVKTWLELIERFQRHAGNTIEIAYTLRGEPAKTARFPIPHSLHTLLGVGPEARILSIAGRDTVTVSTDAGRQELSVHYRAGAKAILEELVGQTKVPVEYRANPLAEKKVAYIDVTAEAVDLWLSRVSLAPSVLPGPEMVLLRGENVLDAVQIGVHKTYYFILQIYTFLERMIFTRSLGLESMSGPLGIFDMGGQVARADFVKFLFFLAMISANLAVINFLPLPIFDGGLMVFLIIEKIKGSPVSLRVQVATQMIGLFLIIGAFLFVTYQDAQRLLG